MLGNRQQQIVDALAGGSFSFEALVRRISPGRAEDRRMITASLNQLADAGLVRVEGEGRRRGRHYMAGTMIALPIPQSNGQTIAKPP
jgi:predicted transcriptional regulator